MVDPPGRAQGITRSAWSILALTVAVTTWATVSTQPVSDPDVWWHVRTGHRILSDGIPRTEEWAFTALGNRWIPTAWLSDCLFAVLHEWGGWGGILAIRWF